MYTHTHTHTHTHQGSSITIDRGLRKNTEKIKDGEIGNHKVNEMGALNMK